MLDHDEFIDIDKGLDKVFEKIYAVVEQQGGLYNKVKERKKRRVWYLDTKRHELKNKNFLLRIREEKEDEFEITLKNRHPDRYIAASYDLSKPIGDGKIRLDEFKFEEDIMPRFVSKFSSSAKFEASQEPKFGSYEDVLSLYPHLSTLGISPGERLTKVNEFEAMEMSYDLGKIVYGTESKAKTQIGLWYLPKEDEAPVIVEFDLDIKGEERSNKKKMILEEFPPSLINSVYDLYTGLQSEDIVDKCSPKTKTEFAYKQDYFQH